MASLPACDALVLFGVTGDLASKMILPALARLAERGVAPRIVGVAHSAREAAAIVGASRERLRHDDPTLAAQMDGLVPRLSIVAGDLDGAGNRLPLTTTMVSLSLTPTRLLHHEADGLLRPAERWIDPEPT